MMKFSPRLLAAVALLGGAAFVMSCGGDGAMPESDGAQAGSILLLHSGAPAQEARNQEPLFRIRTITAGVNLKSTSDISTLESAATFLQKAKTDFENAGYEVQTLRIATQPLPEYLNGLTLPDAIAPLKGLDAFVTSKNIILSVGPALVEDRYDKQFAAWSAELIQETRNISFSVVVSSPDGVHHNGIKSAAEAIVAISKATPGGEGNFRFTASANCPSDIPFFPAAYHRGAPSFAIGLESPTLLTRAFQDVRKTTSCATRSAMRVRASCSIRAATATIA